nr:hypothetical protein [Tanacetum cinerariifolium]
MHLFHRPRGHGEIHQIQNKVGAVVVGFDRYFKLLRSPVSFLKISIPNAQEWAEMVASCEVIRAVSERLWFWIAVANVDFL